MLMIKCNRSAEPGPRRRVDPLMAKRLRYAGLLLPADGDIYDPDATYCIRMTAPQ